MLRATGHARMVNQLLGDNFWISIYRLQAFLRLFSSCVYVKVESQTISICTVYLVPCQTLSGPLPRSGSPARVARGAAAAAPRENGPQRQATWSPCRMNHHEPNFSAITIETAILNESIIVWEKWPRSASIQLIILFARFLERLRAEVSLSSQKRISAI